MFVGYQPPPRLPWTGDARQMAAVSLQWGHTLQSIEETAWQVQDWVRRSLFPREGLEEAWDLLGAAAHIMAVQDALAHACRQVGRLLGRAFEEMRNEAPGHKPLLILSASLNARNSLELAWRFPKVHDEGRLLHLLQEDYLDEFEFSKSLHLRLAQYAHRDKLTSACIQVAQMLSTGFELRLEQWPYYEETEGSKLLLQSAADRAHKWLARELKDATKSMEAPKREMSARLDRAGLDTFQEVQEALHEAKTSELTPARILSFKKNRRITMSQVEALVRDDERLGKHREMAGRLREAMALLPELQGRAGLRLAHPN